MKQVDYFKAQVQYTGDFNELEEQDWRAKAQAYIDSGKDAFDHTDLLDDDTAFKEDGCMWIRHCSPCNHIAEVNWAEMRDEEDEKERIYGR